MEFHLLWKDADPYIPISFIVGDLSPWNPTRMGAGLAGKERSSSASERQSDWVQGGILDRNLDRRPISETRYHSSACGSFARTSGLFVGESYLLSRYGQ